MAHHLAVAMAQKDQWQVTSLGQAQFDLLAPAETNLKKLDKLNPDVVVNCAAYTLVDKAESETEKAFAINDVALSPLSAICNHLDSELVHISTDFVFDGAKKSPYVESDQCHPLSVYGKSKRQGELRVIEECKRFSIFRTSWLYSKTFPCFLTTMLRLAKERDSLNVVNDQIGSPTSALSLAQVLTQYIDHEGASANDIFHVSDEGETSWFDFAVEIFQQSIVNISVNPIPSSDYPTAATRPTYSVMDKTKIKSYLGIELPQWQQALANLLQ